MTIEEFRASLRDEVPMPSLTPLLKALWWDAKGNFDRAHEIAQDDDSGQEAAWVHAYLHRREGDRRTRGTGTSGRTSPTRKLRSMRNGGRSRPYCCTAMAVEVVLDVSGKVYNLYCKGGR